MTECYLVKRVGCARRQVGVGAPTVDGALYQVRRQALASEFISPARGSRNLAYATGGVVVRCHTNDHRELRDGGTLAPGVWIGAAALRDFKRVMSCRVLCKKLREGRKSALCPAAAAVAQTTLHVRLLTVT
jgi:hypothetical protein